jgi:hypothetical protein
VGVTGVYSLEPTSLERALGRYGEVFSMIFLPKGVVQDDELS